MSVIGPRRVVWVGWSTDMTTPTPPDHRVARGAGQVLWSIAKLAFVIGAIWLTLVIISIIASLIS
jgi:hypothetical protein